MGKSIQTIFDGMKAALRSRYLQCFHDAAEIRLLELCGATTLTIGRIKRDGRVMTIVLSNGKLLKSEKFRRVALENKAVLYMNDVGHVLGILGHDYETNVLKYQDMEDSLESRGYRVQFIPQRWLENNPSRALQSVQRFIYT